MDINSGFPNTRRGREAIEVIIDRLSKFAHFLPMSIETASADKLLKMYVTEVVGLHGEPILIVLDRDIRFISRFWTIL